MTENITFPQITYVGGKKPEIFFTNCITQSFLYSVYTDLSTDFFPKSSFTTKRKRKESKKISLLHSANELQQTSFDAETLNWEVVCVGIIVISQSVNVNLRAYSHQI